MLNSYRFLIALGLLCLSPSLFKSAAASSANLNWLADFATCSKQLAQTLCPTKVYEMDIEDPADRLEFMSSSRRRDPLDRFRLRESESSKREPSGTAFNCILPSGTRINCVYLQDADRDLRFLPIIRFIKPYRRIINDGVLIAGPAYEQHASQRLLREWVKFDHLTAPDRDALLSILNSALRNEAQCGSERICKTFRIIKTTDSVGVLARCGQRVIDGTLGPPLHGTCEAEMATVDGEVWAIATTRTLSAYIPSCTLCPICCQLNMISNFNFLAERDFLKAQNEFIRELMSQIKVAFRETPWNFSKVEYNEGIEEFSAISNRRRSTLIDGYEDLYLSIRPPVRFFLVDGSPASRRLFEQPFDKVIRQFNAETELLSKGRAKLAVSVHLEIYRSKYDTSDDSYWIRPTKEQEARYSDALRLLFENAAETACNKVGLRWETDGIGGPTCAAEDQVRTPSHVPDTATDHPR